MNHSIVARLRVSFLLCMLVLFAVVSASVRADDSIVLPVSMTDNRPMIEATINGEGPFHFIVDTGPSDEAVFSERLVKKLALKPTGESESVDGVTLKAVTVPQYTVALKCAGFAANEVKALAIPLTRQMELSVFPYSRSIFCRSIWPPGESFFQRDLFPSSISKRC